MKKMIIKNQVIYSFIDEIKLNKKNTIDSIRRVSFIIPKNKLLRFLFILIRKMKIKLLDNFTRKWKCKWIVIINNKVIFETNNRQVALEYEKEYIRKIGLRNIYNKNNLKFNFNLLKF